MKSTKLIRNVNSVLGFVKWLLMITLLALTIFFCLKSIYPKIGGEFTVNTPYRLNYEQVDFLMDGGAPFSKSKIENQKRTKSPILTDLSNYKIDIERNIEPFSKWGILSFLGMILYFLIILYGIITLQKLLTNVSKHSPFTMDNVGLIRRLAYTVFTYAAVTWLADLVKMFMSLSLNPQQDGATVYFAMGPSVLPVILLGFLILTLSAVFQYGLELKEESELTI